VNDLDSLTSRLAAGEGRSAAPAEDPALGSGRATGAGSPFTVGADLGHGSETLGQSEFLGQGLTLFERRPTPGAWNGDHVGSGTPCDRVFVHPVGA
jgi:hypothetical protein